MAPTHLHIPYPKTIRSYIDAIFEICLLSTPIVFIILDGQNMISKLMFTLPLCIWAIIPPLLEISFLLSATPLLTLNDNGIYFYYPFKIGFIDWMEFDALATQKVYLKDSYRFTFQNSKQIASRLPLFKRLLFYRIYRKHDLLISQSNLALSKQEFFKAIQEYSNVAPDNVDI